MAGHIGSCNVRLIDGQDCPLPTACQLRDRGDLRVYPLVRGDSLLEWNLRTIAGVRKWDAPLEVAIDYSHVNMPQTAAWMELSAYAERGDTYTINKQLVFGNEQNVHFRLRIRSAIGDIYITQPVAWSDDIPARQQSTYREAIRRWGNRLRAGELRQGLLLKRKRWGLYCDTCRDRDGGQQNQSRCLTCYDTGFDGGYYLYPGCVGVDADTQQLSESFDFSKSYTQEGPYSKFLLLNVPQLYPGDVWVDTSNDDRWILGSPMVTTMRLGNVELFRSLPAARIDFTHVIYDFPTGS